VPTGGPWPQRAAASIVGRLGQLARPTARRAISPCPVPGYRRADRLIFNRPATCLERCRLFVVLRCRWRRRARCAWRGKMRRDEREERRRISVVLLLRRLILLTSCWCNMMCAWTAFLSYYIARSNKISVIAEIGDRVELRWIELGYFCKAGLRTPFGGNFDDGLQPGDPRPSDRIGDRVSCTFGIILGRQKWSGSQVGLGEGRGIPPHEGWSLGSWNWRQFQQVNKWPLWNQCREATGWLHSWPTRSYLCKLTGPIWGTPSGECGMDVSTLWRDDPSGFTANAVPANDGPSGKTWSYIFRSCIFRSVIFTALCQCMPLIKIFQYTVAQAAREVLIFKTSKFWRRTSCQILWLSVKSLLGYGGFQNGGCPPSWIRYTRLDHPRKVFVVYVTVQNLVGIDAVVSIICKF